MKRSVLFLAAATFASLAAAQSGPTPFTYVERTNVATNALITSEAKTVSGFVGPLEVRVSGEGNPQYKVGAGVFTSNPGTILAGQTLTVRHTSSTHATMHTISTVTVGDYSTPFKSVTGATDRTPDPFDFGTVLHTFPNTFVESQPRTLGDFNTGVAVTAGSGAQYRIDNGPWTNAAGTLNPGQALTLRHLTPSTELAWKQSTVTVGGVTGSFTTRNRSNANQLPVADAGADLAVDENHLVRLGGSGSDAEGPVTFAWTQVAGPAVTLENAGNPDPTFTAPDVTGDTVLSFRLTVTDDTGATATDTVDVTVFDTRLLSIGDAAAAEGAALTFTVTVTPAPSRPVSVLYYTVDGSADGADYTPTQGTLTLAVGQTSAQLTVPTTQDGADETDEAFSLGLGDAIHASIADGVATGTIEDDDAGCRDFGPESLCTLVDQVLALFEDAPVDDAALAAAAADTAARGCDFLDTSNCLYPFPNNFFTVDAADDSPQSVAQGGTGRRVNFNIAAMPRNSAGKPVDPTEWNRNDGFSPGALITTYVPNLSLEQTFGLPSHEIGLANLALSQDPDSPILVLEVAEGLFEDPVPHLVWAELDQNANQLTIVGAPNVGTQEVPGVTNERGHVARPLNDGKAALLIRPAKNFAEGKRYVVVLRNLKDGAGNAIAPQFGFSACVRGDSALPTVQERCAKLEQDVFPVLDDAGIDPAGVYLAWDFTVQSTGNAIGRLRHMRDDAFASLSGDPDDEDCTQLTDANAATCAAPAVEVTHVQDNPQNGIARRIEGTITVPSYLVPFEPAPGDDAPVSGAIHAICDNAGPLEGNCRGSFRDAADLAQGVTTPNRLFYRPGDGAVHTDASQLPFGDGLPDSVGPMQARFLCQIPSQATPDAPARASLYGHGQLDRGVAITYEGVPDQAREHNYMFCAVDWFGFRTGDAANVLGTLTDLSTFAVVPDASQQGMLNFMFLARAMQHPRGFGALPAFQDQASGRPLFDRSEIFYDGNSQGGIFGGVVLAASKDVNRGVLGSLGMNYSTLLTRSANFDEYAGVLYSSYTDPLDRQLLFSMIQMLWDRGENDGYASHLLDNSAFGGPANDVLLAPNFGDPQVTMWTADVMARTMGAVPTDWQQTQEAEARGAERGANGRRHPDVEPYYALPGLDYGSADVNGSALVVWDANILEGQYAHVPPITNTPPYNTKDDGIDPHDTSQRTPIGRCTLAHFMRIGGTVIDAVPLIHGGAHCPPIPPAAPTVAPDAEPQAEGFDLGAALAEWGDAMQGALEQLAGGDPAGAVGAALGATGDLVAGVYGEVAQSLGEAAGLSLPPPAAGAVDNPPPEPLLAGVAKRAIAVPVGVPLGGYLRPPVGGEYVGDPAGEATDNIPVLPDGCDQAHPETCQPLAPPPDELRTVHSPYATYFPPSRGYYDSLVAKAVALYDGHDYVVFVKMDFIGMLDEVVQAVKQDVKARTGIDLGDGLIMSATHTHDGPGALANHSTRYFWLAMDAYQPELFERLVPQVADLVIEALDDLQPARFGHALGREEDGATTGRTVNSYRNGHENVVGIRAENDDVRRRLGVLRVDAVDGTPLAVVMNYAAHGIAFDIENLYFSGDVLGAAEREVEQGFTTPVVAMLVQNTGGNVSPRADGGPKLQRIERFGKLLAPQVRAVYDGIGTFDTQPDLRAVSQRIVLSRETIGYPDADGKNGDGDYPYPWGAAQCNGAEGAPTQEAPVQCIVAPPPDADDLADNGVAENGAFVPMDTIMTAAKIGDAMILAQPGEPLTEYGVRVLKAAAEQDLDPSKTYIWGYAQDHVGYLLADDKADWERGKTEGTTTFWGWKLGDRLLKANVALMQSLRDGTAAPADEFQVNYFYRDAYKNVPRPPVTPSLLPGAILAQPKDIARFGATKFVFEGGDPVLDLPTVTLLNADGTPARRANGEIIDTLFEMHLKYRLVNGQHLWTVEFEAPKDWAAGSYRFHVSGRANQGREIEYELESADFAVAPATTLQAQDFACADGRCSVHIGYTPVPTNYRLIDVRTNSDASAPMRTGSVTFTNGTDTVVVEADGSGNFVADISGTVTVSAVDAWGNTTPPAGGPEPDADADGVPDADDQCPTEAGPVSNNGCPEEPAGPGFPLCEPVSGDDYCISDIDEFLPVPVGSAIQGLVDTVYNAVFGGGGENNGPDGVWLAGDMHVHDDHSSDGSGMRQTMGQGAPGTTSVADQITFAETQGLDFLPLTDHRTFDQHYDPQWTSGALLLITGEEANSSPHANVFGAVDMINQANNPPGAPDFRRVQQSIWDAHAQGAAWSTNHPDDGETQSVNADGTGFVPNSNAFAVGPDLAEFWNRGGLTRPKIGYAENRWNAGYRFGIAGASDNHFRELWAVAGPGQPLTRVLTAEQSTPALLDALKGGRTTISLNNHAPTLTFTGDFDGDGKFETVGGDERILPVGESVTLRVTVTNGSGTTADVYRTPGVTNGAAPFQTFAITQPEQRFDFTVTADVAHPQDWYRVELRGPGEPDAIDYNKALDGEPQNALDPDPAKPLRAASSPIFISTETLARAESPELPADNGGAPEPVPAAALFGGAEDNAFAGFADVAVADGVVHTVAEVRMNHESHVLYRARLGDGTLTAPVDIASTQARQPAIAARGKDVYVVWQQVASEMPHQSRIFQRHSDDGGVTWRPELIVSTRAGRAQRPDVALTSEGRLVVVWEDNADGAFDVYARIGRDHEENLSAVGKTVIAGNGYDSRSAIYPASVSPKIAVGRNGEVAVAWQDNRFDVDPGWTGHMVDPTDPDQVAASVQEPGFIEQGTETDDWEIMAVTLQGGVVWDHEPVNVSHSPGQADRHVTLAYDAAGVLHAAWDSKDKNSAAGPRLEIRTSASVDGASWPDAQPVAKDANYSSQRPVFGADSGGLSLFWMDGRSADWRWRVRRASLAGATWNDAGFVTGPGNGTWPSYGDGWLVFTSDRNATREQRKPHQVFVLPLAVAEPPADADGDGVPDANDLCPSEAGPASNNGCPVVPPVDSDGDGVPDASDQCPGTPSGTPVGANGCPIEQAGGFPLCEPVSGDDYCISDIPVIGALVQGAVDAVYNAVTGGGVPYNPAELAIDCTGPAGDFEPGTPGFAKRDAENIYCTTERHQQLMQHPANNPYMMENYGADPYRAPARNAGKRFRHADITIAGVDAQEGTSFHPSADSNAEVYLPCTAGTCSDMPAGLQTFEPPYPIAIIMHGAASDKKHLEWVTQPLAEHGYFVLTANGTGPGLPDVLLDWLFDPANPYASQLDLKRIGTAGHSLGAENATRVQGDGDPEQRVSGIVAFDPCDGSGDLIECRDSAGSRVHDQGSKAKIPTLFLAADYLGFPGWPQPQISVPGDLRVDGFGILRNNNVDTMLVTPRATTHLDWAGAFTFGNRLNEATSLYYTMAWFDRYVNGKLAVDDAGNVITTHGRSEGEERAYRQAVADGAFAHLTAAKFDGMVDRHNISQGYYDRLKAVMSGDLEYGGNVPFTVKDLPLADRLSFYHRSVCFISQPDYANGGVLARADTTEDGDMRKDGCAVVEVPADADGDGVPDASDQCPNEPGPAANNGCPVEPPADADGDGVPDASDQCPDTPSGTPVDANGCPVEEGEGFPYHCDEFFGSGYCIEDIPGVGGAIGGALDTAWNTLNGGGGEPPPPPPVAPGESLASCALNQDPAACQAALESLQDLQDCEFDESGINCAYEVAHDAIGVDTAADYLHGLFAQCAASPGAPACEAIRSGGNGAVPDRIIVASRMIERGSLTYTEQVLLPATDTRTIDGKVRDYEWRGTGSRFGGTSMYQAGEHIYNDFLFDALGADDGDDARRLAVLALTGDVSDRLGRIDALQQAANDQLDVPPPAGTVHGDHYGDATSRQEGTDLTEVRWAAYGSNLYFLARVANLQDASAMNVVILADTDDAASGMEGLGLGLGTDRFDTAFVLNNGAGARVIDLVSGVSQPLAAANVAAAVGTESYDNALEARIPRALLERADGTLRVAVMTLASNGRIANVAYRHAEPVTIYNERAQALALFAGTVDPFVESIAVADLLRGRNQTVRPGPGYHERQFISGSNISNEADNENGRLQPYGLFVPHNLAVNVANQPRMTIWTHYRGGKAHSGAAWTPRLFTQLGEEQGNLVVSPRGRGTSTWYTTRAHQDFFEVFADVAGRQALRQYATENLAGDSLPNTGSSRLFDVDQSRIYISGYSMGGYATYLFTGLYPDLFAGGFSQSGAVTQGAWTGIGPDPGDAGHDQACGMTAPEDFPEVGGGSPCFIEANEGRANAQLNYRLLENTLHVPLEINHGTNDELALTPGAVRMGERLLELGYRHDMTLFLGYEHFTQAIVDEWADGSHYINQFARPENPRQVTYKVVPALVEAINEVHVDGYNAGRAFRFHPDGAYWVDGLVVRDTGCTGPCDSAGQDFDPAKYGRIDAESARLPGNDHVTAPRTGSDANASAPYASTPVYSPGNHTTPFARSGLDWVDTLSKPESNSFTASLVNLSVAVLDLERMGQHFDEPIDGTVTSDGAAVLWLADIRADMTLCVGGAFVEDIYAWGNAGVTLASGTTAIRLVPGHGSACDATTPPPPAPDNGPDYADVCESFGIAGSEPVCGALRDAEQALRDGCENNGGSDSFCTLTGGNLHSIVETCSANDPSEGAIPACRIVGAFVEGAGEYCRGFSNASGGAQPPELCALLSGVLISEGALQQYEASWVHKALALQSRLGFGLPLAQVTLLHTHNSFNATTSNTPPTLSGSDFNQYYSIPDQLRMDIRAVEMDAHWMPGPEGTAETMGLMPMLCHGRGGSELNAGCTTERPLRAGLAEVRAWLDAHPDEVVMLYIEDDIGGSPFDRGIAHDTTAQVVEDEIGEIVYRPAEHGSTCDNDDSAKDAGSTSWLNVSRAQMLAARKQVLLVTETCAGGAWDDLFHQKNDGNWTQGTQGSFEGFSYEGGCRMPDDAGFMNSRHDKATRIWEDTTVVTATAGGGAPAAVTPGVMRETMRCGMSLPGMDRLYPADGRLQAAVWSWDKDEPVASPTLNCAALRPVWAGGRFHATDCSYGMPYACVDDNDPDRWSISAAAGPWSGSAGACPAGTHFGVPANGYALEQLKAASAAGHYTTVWLNYTDAGTDGEWIAADSAAPAGPPVPPPPGEDDSACAQLGVSEAICDGVDSALGALSEAMDTFFGADPHPAAPLSPALQQCHDSGVATAVCARLADVAGDGGLSRWVDPRIGSYPPGFTNPGPTAPYGMVQPGPDTEGPLNFGGYYFHNTLVSGFSQVHMSAGVYKAGYFPMLPFTGERTTGELPSDHAMPAYSSGLDHSLEAADAGYYSAMLTRYAVHAELTASERVAFHRYTFNDPTQAPRVLIDVARTADGYRTGSARLAGGVLAGSVSTGRFPIFFAARFSAPFTATTFDGASLGAAAATLSGANTGVILDFADAPPVVLVKVGISYTDEAGALANLDAEIPGWDFDALRARTRAKWDEALARIEVEGGTYGDRVSFYTALYHAQQFPNLHSDVDGRYRGPDMAIYADTRPHYSQFSSWDSYRGQNQLQAEMVPDLYDDMIHSLIAFGEQNGGVMPRWQEGSIDASHMTGDPIIPFIGEAWCRGALAADTREALWPLLTNLPEHRDALLRAAGYEAVEPVETFGDTGVAQIDDVQKLLFEAQDVANPTGGAAASATLEYGIADFSLALMAQSVPGADSAAIAQRSLNYRNLMDPETQWIRPRNADGSWLTPFLPENGYGFQEGTSWQYSWMVMHDYAGVFERMGGEAAASQRLDTFFNLPASAAAPIAWPTVQNQITLFGISYVGNQYAPGNEHDLQAPYVYNYTGEPWKTQAVARAAGSIYTPTINGMPGNDDLGALSGWLVWNMAGLYPMNPGTPLALVGSPVFEKVTLHRPTGDLVIEAPGASGAGKYVQSVAIDGKPSAQSWLVLPRGATTVRLEMGEAPNFDFGRGAFARPPSVSTASLADFGCSATAAPTPPAGLRVEVSATAVRVGNERLERTWSRKPFRTSELVDPRNGRVWSRDSADFTLNFDGLEIGSDQFEVSGDPTVQRQSNGATRVTFRLVPSGFGAAPLGLWLERTIEMYPDVSGMRSETWLHSPVPLVISGYSVDEARPPIDDLTGTIHSFRAGADWRNPGEETPWAPTAIGDAQAGDWRASSAGATVGGTAQWMSINDAQDARLFFVLERNDYASSQMSFDGSRAKAHVDLSRDVIYIGPFEESAHVQNPGPGPGRHRVVMPGVPLRLEPVFTGFGIDGADEPWQHYKYLAKYRMPAYRREITFNSNGVDSNRISTGAKDDMDFAETQRQAAIAAELGIETFILDDGWQARSGDWCPDSPDCREANRLPEAEPAFPPVNPGADYTQPRYPARFPDSSFSAVREVLADNGGMNLGLWMTPLHFHPTAEVFQQNPQWACQPISDALVAYNAAQPYSSSNEAGLAQWNLEAVGPNGKAVDYIEGRIRRAIDDWGVKYFKFDFTAWLDCGGANTVDMYGYRESFMAMLDRILRDHPDVTIQMDETNDYRLFPFEAIARGPTWYQNGGGTTNGALHANHVLLPWLPPYALGRGAVQPGSFASKSPDYQMAIALLSHMTFFNDLTGIPEAARPAIRRWTDYYKAHRADFAQLTYPLLDEDPIDEGTWAAFQAWNPEAGRGALLVYRQDSAEAVKTIRLRNVPDGTYRLFEAPHDTPVGAATAAQLREGLPIMLPATRSAKVLRIERLN